jgi:hypothetical protein
VLVPGIVFSIWGHNYGPKDGCKGPATEVCGVQVLLDGVPIEVQFTSDVLINARMPESAGPAISKLVVVSGGVRSEPIEVRRQAEIAEISLDGVARVGGPVWIRVQLPHGSVSYPVLGWAADFGCASFEVRKDGKLLPAIAPPRGAFGGSFGSPRAAQIRGRPDRRTGYRCISSSVLTSQESMKCGRRITDLWCGLRATSECNRRGLRFEVLPAVARTPIGAHSQEPDELPTNFLPNLMAVRDDETLGVLMEYLYHPSPQVRGWVLSALAYWPDSVVQPRLMETLRANGPSNVVVQGIKGNTAEVAEISLPFLFSSDAVLFQGALTGARCAIAEGSGIDAVLRLRVERVWPTRR